MWYALALAGTREAYFDVLRMLMRGGGQRA
jgi:hypothetical protein